MLYSKFLMGSKSAGSWDVAECFPPKLPGGYPHICHLSHGTESVEISTNQPVCLFSSQFLHDHWCGPMIVGMFSKITLDLRAVFYARNSDSKTRSLIAF